MRPIRSWSRRRRSSTRSTMSRASPTQDCITSFRNTTERRMTMNNSISTRSSTSPTQTRRYIPTNSVFCNLLQNLSAETQVQLSVDMTIAILVSQKIYNYSELVPLTQSSSLRVLNISSCSSLSSRVYRKLSTNGFTTSPRPTTQAISSSSRRIWRHLA